MLLGLAAGYEDSLILTRILPKLYSHDKSIKCAIFAIKRPFKGLSLKGCRAIYGDRLLTAGVDKTQLFGMQHEAFCASKAGRIGIEIVA